MWLLGFGHIKNPRKFRVEIELDRGGIWKGLPGVFDRVQFDLQGRGDSVDSCLPAGSIFDGPAEVMPAPVEMASRWHFAVMG